MYEVPQIGEFFVYFSPSFFPFWYLFTSAKKTTTTTIPKNKTSFSFFAPSKITPTVITDNKFYCSAYIWPPVKISFSFVFCHTLFAKKRKKKNYFFCPYCSPPKLLITGSLEKILRLFGSLSYFFCYFSRLVSIEIHLGGGEGLHYASTRSKKRKKKKVLDLDDKNLFTLFFFSFFLFFLLARAGWRTNKRNRYIHGDGGKKKHI